MNKRLSCTCFVFLLILMGLSFNIHAQNRLSTRNTLVWLNQFHTINIHKHWAVTAEYQWRRTEGFKSWQQSLLRGGVLYKFSNGWSVLAGYGWIETFPYGDYPAAAPQPFPEHRIYQQATWSDQVGRIQLAHRGRLEQRFLGVLDPSYTDGRKITKWNYLNRVRYQVRATLPLNNPVLQDKTLYAAAFDELFIGFGKSINANIFDQNRFGLQLGYRLNKRFSLEAGYFNQILQQPQPVSGKSVFQYNNGFMLNLNCSWN